MWPEDRRCAVAFSFDFDAEEVWIGEDPDNARRPGVLSQGTYGAKVAVPEILRILERTGVRSTFFVPGRVAENHPHRVEDIVAAGHELGLHGYTHRSPTTLSREEEEEELDRAIATLGRFSDDVRGFRSPSWDLSPITLELLAARRIAWSSNLMDDIRPYRHDGTGLIELPVQWTLDDAPHFWFDPASWTKKISTVGEVRDIWERELLGIRELGGSCIITMHPQIIGRPGRLGFLEEFILWTLDLGDAWVTTCGEIAARADAALSTAEASL